MLERNNRCRCERTRRKNPSSAEQPRPQRRLKRKPVANTETAQGGIEAVVRHAPAGHPMEESRDVRGRGRHGPDSLYIIVEAASWAEHESGAAQLFHLALDVWLFLTVLFANFASALAEARGKAQAESLRKTRRDTPAYRLRTNGSD